MEDKTFTELELKSAEQGCHVLRVRIVEVEDTDCGGRNVL